MSDILVLSPDVLLVWAPGNAHRRLLRTWTGHYIECANDAPHPVVAAFFHAPVSRAEFKKCLGGTLPGAEASLECLLRENFVVLAAELPPRTWRDPDPVDMAMHHQAGWPVDSERHGRDIVSRLEDEPPHAKAGPSDLQIPLPEPSRLALPLDQALSSRRTHRRFGYSPLDADQLSTLLWHTAGTQGYLSAPPFTDAQARPYPSGGGRHPLELYVVVRRPGTGLPAGAFHWDGVENRLAKVGTVPDETVERNAFEGRAYYLEAPVWIAWSAVLERRSFKYDRTVMRNILVESGAMLQNLYLCATALGLGACVFDVRREPIEGLFGIDPIREPLLHGLAVGYAADLSFVRPAARSRPHR